MSVVLKIDKVCKQYGAKQVLTDVSMTINKGDIYGLVGRNGAGKTTIMKIILGMTRATGGSFQVLDGKSEDMLRVGSIIELPTFIAHRSAYLNLAYIARLRGMKDYDAQIDEIFELIDLVKVKNDKVKTFSLGMKQKLAIGMSLLNNPKLLILDEPINGLDPISIREVRDILKKINSQYGTTIMISSHILTEMQKLATRYGFIDNGKLVGEISEKEIEEKGLDLEKYVLDLMGGGVHD